MPIQSLKAITVAQVGHLCQSRNHVGTNRGTFYSSEVINIFFLDIIKDLIKCMMHDINKNVFRRKKVVE
jgi:hypothetical protein